MRTITHAMNTRPFFLPSVLFRARLYRLYSDAIEVLVDVDVDVREGVGCRICPTVERLTTKLSTLTLRDVTSSSSDLWTVTWLPFL